MQTRTLIVRDDWRRGRRSCFLGGLPIGRPGWPEEAVELVAEVPRQHAQSVNDCLCPRVILASLRPLWIQRFRKA